jgi:addiction module HigA family antidote
MAEYRAGKRKRSPTHPGEVIADILATLRVSTRRAAGALHVSPMALNNVITGKTAVSTKMALRLGRLFGNGAELWLNLQRDYDLWHDSRAMQEQLAEIRPIDRAAA